MEFLQKSTFLLLIFFLFVTPKIHENANQEYSFICKLFAHLTDALSPTNWTHCMLFLWSSFMKIYLQCYYPNLLSLLFFKIEKSKKSIISINAVSILAAIHSLGRKSVPSGTDIANIALYNMQFQSIHDFHIQEIFRGKLELRSHWFLI